MPTQKKSLGTKPQRKRRTPRKQATTGRGRNPHADPIPRLSLDPKDIQAHGDELRLSFPNLSDDQCRLALLVVQTGYDLSHIAKLAGFSRSWVYTTSLRADWCDYLNGVSMRALGWARAQAHGVMAQLMTHPSPYIRMNAASELMERGGHRIDPPKSAALSVTLNFSNGSAALALAPQAEEPSLPLDGTHAISPPEDGPSKTQGAQGGGSPSHSAGEYAVIRKESAVDVDVEEAARESPTGGSVDDGFDW